MPPHRSQRRKRQIKNLSLAAVAALAGLASVIITFTGLFFGMWLDAITGREGLFTVLLLILSVPVSLFTMLRVVLSLVGRIIPQPPQRKQDQTVPDDVEED